MCSPPDVCSAATSKHREVCAVIGVQLRLASHNSTACCNPPGRSPCECVNPRCPSAGPRHPYQHSLPRPSCRVRRNGWQGRKGGGGMGAAMFPRDVVTLRHCVRLWAMDQLASTRRCGSMMWTACDCAHDHVDSSCSQHRKQVIADVRSCFWTSHGRVVGLMRWTHSLSRCISRPKTCQFSHPHSVGL